MNFKRLQVFKNPDVSSKRLSFEMFCLTAESIKFLTLHEKLHRYAQYLATFK